MKKEVKAMFVRERECKHSVRYVNVDEGDKLITPTIYITRTTLADLGNPNKLMITVSTDIAD